MKVPVQLAKREKSLRRVEEVLKILKTKGSQKVRESMERFGITADHAVGITTPVLKTLARMIGRREYHRSL